MLIFVLLVFWQTVTVSVTNQTICFHPALADHGGCVTLPNVTAENGMLHIIDSVLLPYFVGYPITALAVDVQDTLRIAQLVHLVECAGLAELLNTTFGITVLAPTDDALAEIDVNHYCSETGMVALVDILSFHVVTHVLPSTQIYVGKKSVATLYGKPLCVERDAEDTIMFGGANVITEDILAHNGVIHVIDQVSTFPVVCFVPRPLI